MPSWRRNPPRPPADATTPEDAVAPSALARFLATVAATFGPARAEDVARTLLANPAAFATHNHLLPLLEFFDAHPAQADALPAAILRETAETCAHELLARIEHRPAEPADWAQPATFPANTPELRTLQTFARDPEARVLRLRANEGTRAELHRLITAQGLDMTHVTERRGRPYTLVCTKTRTAHERALLQYDRDRAAMRRLLALRPATAPLPPALASRLHAAIA